MERILSALARLDIKMDEMNDRLIMHSAKFDTLEHELRGNGQPGWMKDTDRRLGGLESTKVKLMVWAGVGTLAVTLVFQAAQLISGHLMWK